MIFVGKYFVFHVFSDRTRFKRNKNELEEHIRELEDRLTQEKQHYESAIKVGYRLSGIPIIIWFITGVIIYTLGCQIGIPTPEKGRGSKCWGRTLRWGSVESRRSKRAANKHVKDALMLAITSYTPRYKKCTKSES